MSERRDRLKSLFRQAVHTAQAGIEKIPGLQQLQKAARELANFGGIAPVSLVQKDVLRIEGVSSVSVDIDESGIRIQASFNDADDVALRIVPEEVRFAPRGPKEIAFRIEPADAARHRYAPEFVGAVSTSIARAVWAAALGEDRSTASAIVDREGDDRFRVDLRTLSILRNAKSQHAAALLLEALVLESVHPVPGLLRLRVKLPFAF